MSPDYQVAFDHAWRYFALHADQRISVFNFYVASSGLLLTGLAYVLATNARLWLLGLVSGLLVSALSVVFWKLDQRSAEMIKVSETVLGSVEAGALPSNHRVLSGVAALSVNASPLALRSAWSFGRSFRLLFLGVGLLGLLGGTLAALGWNAAPAAPAARPQVPTGGTPKRPTVERDGSGRGTERGAKSPGAGERSARGTEAETRRSPDPVIPKSADSACSDDGSLWET